MTTRSRRSVLIALLWLVAAVASVAEGRAAGTTVVDDRGHRFTFDQPPRRIVTLLPSITESVCGLGACDRLVGTDRYSDWPGSVVALPKLGGLDDAQIEGIVALKPDLVLAARSARVTDRLESLGLTVLLIDSQTHADVKRSLEIIAAVLGTPADAGRVWSGIERDLQAAAARVPASLRGRRIYFEIGSAPYAAGAGSFIGETLARLGLDNIVPAAMGPFPQLNPEYVVRSRPDIVIAAGRDLATMADRPGWQSLDALKHGRTCGFDADRYRMLTRPGPRMGEAALALADCLARLP